MPNDDSAYVLSLPLALRVTQFVRDGMELDSDIRPLSESEIATISAERLASVAQDASESDALRAALLVWAEAWAGIAIDIDRKAAIRVLLGPSED